MALDPRDLERLAFERWGASNPVAAGLESLARLRAEIDGRLLAIEGRAVDAQSRSPAATPIDPSADIETPAPAGGLTVQVKGRPVWIGGAQVLAAGATVTVPRPGDPIVRTPISASNLPGTYDTGGAIQTLAAVEGETRDGIFLTMADGIDFTADLPNGTVTILSTANTQAARRFLVSATWAAGEWTVGIMARDDGTIEAVRGTTDRPEETLVEAGLDHEGGVLLAAVVRVSESAPAVSAPMIDAARGEFVGNSSKTLHRLGSYERNRVRRGIRFKAESAGDVLDVGIGAGGESGPVLAAGSSPESFDVFMRREVVDGIAQWAFDPALRVALPRVLFVSPDGDDATGRRGDLARPFATLPAAQAASVVGDLNLLLPGTHTLSADYTLVDGVNVRGVSLASSRISRVATSAATMLTMGENMRLEDVAVSLTSSGHYTLTGILWPGTTPQTSKLRTATVTVDNSGAGAGTSQVVASLVRSTAFPGREIRAIRAVTMTVRSADLGVKRGILVDTSACNFNMSETNIKTTGGTDSGAAEVNFAGATLGLDSGSFDGATFDWSETAGTLRVNFALPVNANANGKGFTADGGSSNISVGDPGGLPSNATRYFYDGTYAVTATEIMNRVARKSILKTLSVKLATAPGAGKTDTFTLRKNGVDTGLTVSISNAATSGVITNASVSFAAGDERSFKAVTAVATGSSQTQITTEVY